MKNLYLFILNFLLVLPLYSEQEEIEEIVSVVSSVPQKETETNMTIDLIKKEDLKKFASTNLISILSGYLGIDTSSNGGPGQYASLFLRGSNSNHTLVKVNGVKINPSTAGGASISNIDPSLISQIEVGSGPFSSIHGSEAIGGVINISTLSHETDSSLQLSVSGGADNFRKESFQKNWLNKNNSYNVFLLKSKSEGFPSLISSSIDSGFNNKSLGGSYTAKKSKTQTEMSTWISKGRTEYLDFQSNPLSQDYENSIHSANIKFKHKEPYLLYLNLSSSKDLINQNQFNYINQKDITETDNQNVQFIVYSPSDKYFSYIVGYEQEKQKVNYSSFGTRFKKNIKTTSLFIENKIQLNRSLVGINFRFSDHDSYGLNKSWNIGYKKSLNQQWFFRFNSGSAFRSPNRGSISDSESFNPKTARTTFKISIGDTSEYRLLPELIKQLTISAPEVDIESYLTPRMETPKELATGNIDFAIDPPIHADPSLSHQKIYEDEYVLIVNKKHPIASKKKISIKDYLSLSHIHISKRPTGIGHVDMTLSKLGLSRRIALRAQHFLVAPYILDQSDLAITSIKSFARGRDLKIFSLPFEIDPLILHLYWHGNKIMIQRIFG